MFSRASQVLHVCLRCQNRIETAKPGSLRSRQLTWQHTQVIQHRWNSSAAALKEEQDGDNESTESRLVDGVDDRHDLMVNEDHEVLQRRQGNSNVAQSIEDQIDDFDLHDESQSSRRLSNTRFRHWRPPATAAMGVNFLGQPGEILVLPERSRKKKHRKSQSTDEEIPESTQPAPATDEARLESVYETLRNEHKPMSKDEIITSINGIRDKLPSSESSSVSEVIAQKLLDKSFSRSQLDTYIRSSAPTNAKLPDKTARRGILAAYIVQRIWCLNPAEEGWNIQLTSSVKELIRMLKQSPAKVDLRTALETSDGFKGTNLLARRMIEKLAADVIGPKWLNKPKILYSVASTSPEQLLVQSWAKSKITNLARQSLILLKGTNTSPKYKAHAFSKPSFANFARELFLTYREVDHFAQSLQAVEPDRKNILLPLLERDLILEGEKHLLVKSSGSSHGPENEELAEPIFARLQKKLVDSSFQFNTCKELNLDPKLKSRAVTAFSIDFGKAGVNYFDTGESNGLMQPTFSTRMPFLSQFLSQQQYPSAASHAAQSRISRLLYKPRGPINLPELEIYADLSESSNILIRQINLQFPQVTEIVSLPQDLTDMRISRDEAVSIFSKDEALEEHLAPLIGSIAEQLPFAHRPTNLYHPGNLNVSYTMDLDFSVLTSPSTANVEKTMVSYNLETAQEVQSIAYAASQSNTTTLEHVSCTPAFKSLLSESLQRSQMLRMVEAHPLRLDQLASSTAEPAPSPLGDGSARLREIVKNAYGVARAIDLCAKSESEKLMSRYPKVD